MPKSRLKNAPVESSRDLSTGHCSLSVNQTQFLLPNRSFTGEIQDGRKCWRAMSLPECSPRPPDKVCCEHVKEEASRFCRVRSFKSTGKGLVRNGDSLTSKDSCAFVFSGSVRCYRQRDGPVRSDSKDSSDSSATVDSCGGSSLAESYYRVAVLGAPKVGKTVLIGRFLAYEEDEKMSMDEQDMSSRTVSVLLDGDESLLEFFDDLEEMSLICPLCSPNTIPISGSDPSAVDKHSLSQHRLFCDVTSRPGEGDIMRLVTRDTTIASDGCANWGPFRLGAFAPVQEPVTCDNVACQFDAYTVIFSVTDLKSFQYGCTKVRHLREDLGTDRPIILVGNKADLVRKRCVSAKAAMMLAHKYDCKYTETSALFGHQTDELLVGILRQISRKLHAAQELSPDSDVTDAARKRSRWRKLSKLRKFLDKAVKTRDSYCDVLA